MADRQGGFDRRRAVSLLQEATRFIAECSRLPNPTTTERQSTSNENGQTQRSTEVQSNERELSIESERRRALGNFRDLFAPYGNGRRTNMSSCNQSADPPAKRKKQSLGYKRETWTHTFVCLSNREQCAPPSVALKAKLQQAGLGRKKICFNWKANAADVKRRLEEVYPKLGEGGGFELLRRGAQTNELTVIQPPRSGYSVPFLRDTAGLGQAIAFVRPLQCNLDMLPVEDIEDISEVSGCAPLVVCINCKVEVPVTEVRQHQETCCSDDELFEIPATSELSNNGDGTHDPNCLSGQVQAADNHTIECIDCQEEFPAEQMNEHNNRCPGGTSSGIVPRRARASCITSYFENSSASKSVTGASDNSLENIQLIFPKLSSSLIAQALESANGDANNAVASLLGEDGLNIDISDDPIPFYENDTVNDTLHTPPATLKELIAGHKETLQLSGLARCTVSRDSIWEDSIALFKNSKFNFLSRPKVTFEGEAGIDAGGLSREFGCLLRMAMFSPQANLFEGQEHSKLPIYSIDGIHSRLFQLVGKIISYLVVHIDIGVPCLSVAAFKYISTGSLEVAAESCNIDDIVDLELRELVSQVNKATTEEDLNTTMHSSFLNDSLVTAGWLQPLSLKNRSLAMQTLMVHDVLKKRKEPLDQLSKGLETLGILDLIRRHPQLMEPYFVDQKLTQLTSSEIISNFSKDSVADENDRSYQFLIQAVHDLEKEQGAKGMHKLLQYMTSLDRIPPLGLANSIDLEFDEGENFFAETCTLVLRVPTAHNEFEDFKKKLLEACDNSLGFGCI